MLKIIKSSVRDTFIYSIGTFSTKLAGFVLVPIYTNSRYLSETDYGVLNLVEANLQFLISVFGLGLCYAYERWYWDKSYLEKRNTIFFTILVVTICISLLLVVTLFPLSGFFSGLLFESDSYALVFQLMIVNAGFEIVAQTPNSLIRLSEKPVLYTTANLVRLFTSILATVIFVVYLQLGLEGVYYAQILGMMVYFIVLSKFIYQHTTVGFERAALADMLKFRFPFLLPIVALNVFNFNDRFVLSNINGLVEAGVYSLGAKLANTIKVFVITAVWLALTPTIYKMMHEPNNKRFYSKVMTYMSFGVMFFVMGFSFFGFELVDVLAKEEVYRQAANIIPIVSVGIFFGMLKDVSLIGLNITKKTGSIAVTTFIVTGLSLLLNILLIPYLGIYGSALSNVVVQGVFFAVIFVIAQKHYPIPYETGKILMMIFLASVLFVPALLSNDFSVWIRVPVKLLLIAVFPLLLYWLGFYEPVEKERLAGFWKKWKNPAGWKKNLNELQF